MQFGVGSDLARKEKASKKGELSRKMESFLTSVRWAGLGKSESERKTERKKRGTELLLSS